MYVNELLCLTASVSYSFFPIPGHLPHVKVYIEPVWEQPVETSICTIRVFLPVCLPVPHLTALS